MLRQTRRTVELKQERSSLQAQTALPTVPLPQGEGLAQGHAGLWVHRPCEA